MYRAIIFILCFVLTHFVSAQNLIINGSFEEYSSCPEDGYELFKAVPWKGQPIDQVDVFHACRNTPDHTVIPQRYGTSDYELYPRTGNAMGGGFAMKSALDYRDYFKSKLQRKLNSNEVVYVEYFVVHCTICMYQLKSFDLHFSDQETQEDPQNILLNLESHIYKPDGYISDTMKWTKISGFYRAKGTEQHITIGNFKSDIETDYVLSSIPNQTYQGEYYFIDDVSVIPFDSIAGGIPAYAGPDHTIFTNDSVFIGQNMSGNFCNWYHNGNLISQHTEFGFYVKPTQAVNQYVVIQDLGGVIDSDTAYVYVKDAGLKPIQKQILSVSPNPSSGSFLLSFGNTTLSEISIQVTDLNGRIIDNRTLQLSNGQATLELSEPSGVYLMCIQNSFGTEVQKLTIQK